VLTAVLLTVLQRSSFADLQLAYHPLPGQYANRRAFVFALLALLVSFFLAVSGFVILLWLRGYTSWDSTLLHFPTELLIYLLDAALPALLVAYVVERTYHFCYLVTPRDAAPMDEDDMITDRSATPSDANTARSAVADEGGAPPEDDAEYSDSRSDDDDRESRDGGGDAGPSGRRSGKDRGRFGRTRRSNHLNCWLFCSRLSATSAQYLRSLCLGQEAVYSDLSMIYLIKVYLFTLALLAHLILACLASRSYTFMLPPLLLVHFDVEEAWTYRFQLLTLQLVSGCLLAAATLAMVFWPAADLSTAYYDRLYALAVLKYERRRGATAKSDDVIAMLEEETEALVRARYQVDGSHDD